MSQKKYRLAVALLHFKSAYKELVAASKAMPDYDISENYPFYLLDYEGIERAVLQWCTIHASKLLQDIPDRVDNPACISCPDFRIGIGADGQCKGKDSTRCCLYPYIMFSKEMAVPVLKAAGIDAAKLHDTEVFLLYLKRMDEIYAEKQSSPDVYIHTRDERSGSAT